MTARPNLPIGMSDFRRLREDGMLYVDKSAWIGELIGDPALVLVFPRPRRFGKTTNLSLLNYFFGKRDEDLSRLFEGLAVWQDQTARAHFQRYPVLHLSLKDAKGQTFEECLAAMRRVLGNLYNEHRALLDGGRLPADDAARFAAILERRAEVNDLVGSLQDLSRYLFEHHGQRVWALFDEYDTPLHEAFTHGYFDQAVALFRGLFSGVLRTIATCRRRCSRGSCGSPRRASSRTSTTSTCNLCYSRDTRRTSGSPRRRSPILRSERASRVRWTTCASGTTAIASATRSSTNPWSVLSALNRGTCAAYWVNTSSNALIRELLLRASGPQYAELEALLQGGTIRKRISETTVLRGLYVEPEALWSFLVFSGYLRASEVRQEEDGSTTGTLAIPNRELRLLFAELFSEWLNSGLGGQEQVDALGRAVLAGDAESCEHALSLLLESASALDTATSRRAPPEQVYHAFVLGLLLYLQPRWLVRSNRESGFGRSDVLIVPREPGRPGCVLELKVRRKGQTVAKALAEGHRQIVERDYAAELRAHGAAPIHALVAVFDGKQVVVRAGAAGRTAKTRPTATSRRRAR